MNGKTTRTQQAKNTRKKILETSISLFKEYGYDKVTVEQICSKADVTTGAFYHHLKSKAGVVRYGYNEYDEYLAHITLYENDGKTYVEKILNIVSCQMDYVNYLGVKLIRQVYSIQLYDESKFFISGDRQLVKTLDFLIKEAQDKGELKADASFKSIREELIILTRGIVYNWCQNNGSYEIKKQCEIMVSNYLFAYK